MDAYLCDVLYDYNFELVSIGLEEGTNVGGFALGADRAPDREALVKERLHDPNCDVAVGSSNEDLS